MKSFDVLTQIDGLPILNISNRQLTLIQERRLMARRIDGLSRSEIAALDGVTPRAVQNTFKEIIRKAFKPQNRNR